MTAEQRRLADDVQRFGLLSAAAVVERYRQLVDRATDGGSATERPATGIGLADPSWLVDRASRLAAGYLRFLDSAASSIPRAEAVDGMERVLVPGAPPGAVTHVSMWLHNTTETEGRAMEMTCTALVSTGGDSIAAANVRAVPNRLDSLQPGSSAEIRVEVAIPLECRPGRYFGLVHVSASPDDPLALELVVEEVVS